MMNRKNVLTAILLPFILSCLICAISYSAHYWQELFLSNYGLPTTSPSAGRVISVTVGEQDLSRYGTANLWTGEPMVELINKLNADPAAKPAVIGIDHLYTSGSVDKSFVSTVTEAGNVVLAARIRGGGSSGKFRWGKLPQVELSYPDPSLAQVPYGFSSLSGYSTGNGYSRHHSLLKVRSGDKIEYSFAFVLLQIYCRSLGLPEAQEPPTRKNGEWFVQFEAVEAPHHDGSSYTFSELLEGGVLPEQFKDAVVIINYDNLEHMEGAPPSEEQEEAVIMRSRQTISPIRLLMDGNYKYEEPIAVNFAILYIFSFTLYFLFFIVNMRWSGLTTALLAGSYFLFSLFAFERGLVVDMAGVPLTALSLYMARAILRRAQLKKRTYMLESTFKRYVPPSLVDELLSDRRGERLRSFTELGGEKKEIAALFIDIRGFTGLSEILPPEDIITLLNAYFTFVTESIFLHGGMVDKFMGDGVMAIFNAPFDQNDYLYECVSAAWEISRKALDWQQEAAARYQRPLSLGMGVSWGESFVGNVGSQTRMDYTAISDAVNIASRLEGIAEGGQILLDASILTALGERIQTRKIGNVQLKGKSEPLPVYELIGLKENAESLK